MISREELQRIASRKGFKNLQMIEKDYALSWALFAIYSNKKLKGCLLFKGGTCLNKIYAERYRLSEDLDFTLYAEAGSISTAERVNELKKAFEEANKKGAPNLQLKESETHENAGLLTLHAKYIGPLAHPNSIKIEISLHERVKFEPAVHSMGEKNYADVPAAAILCYDFRELFLEKVRAMMERGKSRDYYDVWQMLSREDLKKQLPGNLFELRRDLVWKCKSNGREYAPEKMFSKERIEEARKYWKAGLEYLVREPSDFDEAVGKLRKEFFEENELAEFDGEFPANANEHLRDIARGKVSGPLLLRAVELLGVRLESKKAIEVGQTLDFLLNAVDDKKIRECASYCCLGRLEKLMDDKDSAIKEKAKRLYDFLLLQTKE